MISTVGAVLIAAANLTAITSSGNWICSDLDSSPTVRTVENIVFELIDQGYDAESGSDYIVGAVVGGCPEHLPVLKDFVEKWG